MDRVDNVVAVVLYATLIASIRMRLSICLRRKRKGQFDFNFLMKNRKTFIFFFYYRSHAVTILWIKFHVPLILAYVVHAARYSTGVCSILLLLKWAPISIYFLFNIARKFISVRDNFLLFSPRIACNELFISSIPPLSFSFFVIVVDEREEGREREEERYNIAFSLSFSFCLVLLLFISELNR